MNTIPPGPASRPATLRRDHPCGVARRLRAGNVGGSVSLAMTDHHVRLHCDRLHSSASDTITANSTRLHHIRDPVPVHRAPRSTSTSDQSTNSASTPAHASARMPGAVSSSSIPHAQPLRPWPGRPGTVLPAGRRAPNNRAAGHPPLISEPGQRQSRSPPAYHQPDAQKPNDPRPPHIGNIRYHRRTYAARPPAPATPTPTSPTPPTAPPAPAQPLPPRPAPPR